MPTYNLTGVREDGTLMFAPIAYTDAAEAAAEFARGVMAGTVASAERLADQAALIRTVITRPDTCGVETVNPLTRWTVVLTKTD